MYLCSTPDVKVHHLLLARGCPGPPSCKAGVRRSWACPTVVVRHVARVGMSPPLPSSDDSRQGSGLLRVFVAPKGPARGLSAGAMTASVRFGDVDERAMVGVERQ